MVLNDTYTMLCILQWTHWGHRACEHTDEAIYVCQHVPVTHPTCPYTTVQNIRRQTNCILRLLIYDCMGYTAVSF